MGRHVREFAHVGSDRRAPGATGGLSASACAPRCFSNVLTELNAEGTGGRAASGTRAPACPCHPAVSFSHHRAGLTLVELLLVLFILAVLAGVALRSTESLVDQSRYEASKRTMDELSDVVVGDDNARQLNGTAIVSGFVADLGRLPAARRRLVELDGVPVSSLTLAELWDGTDPRFDEPAERFDIRQAIVANGVNVGEEDTEVFVPTGWRGPYLRLPAGDVENQTLRDGFGTPLVNPAALPPGFIDHHLYDANDAVITAEDVPIAIVRSHGPDDGSVYQRTLETRWAPTMYKAYLRVVVRVQRGDDDGDPMTPPNRDEAEPDAADTITVRVFGPDPTLDNAGKIKAFTATSLFTAPSVTLNFPVDGDADDLTVGPRVVRAYFTDDAGTATSSFDASAVTDVILQPGFNTIELVIDRNRTP